MRIRVTKLFCFEMAHALRNYDGPCRNIHGHSYYLTVTVSGEPVIDRSSAKLGMVIDFGELKNLVQENIINRFDHALVVQKGFNEFFQPGADKIMKIIQTDFQPTSENLVSYFADILLSVLPMYVSLEKLKLSETNSSYVEWFREDQ